MSHGLNIIAEKIVNGVLKGKLDDVDSAKTKLAKEEAEAKLIEEITNKDYVITFHIELYNDNNKIYYGNGSDIKIGTMGKSEDQIGKFDSLYALLNSFTGATIQADPSTLESFKKDYIKGGANSLIFDIQIAIILKYEQGELWAEGFKKIKSEIKGESNVTTPTENELYIQDHEKKNSMKLNIEADENIKKNVEEMLAIDDTPIESEPINVMFQGDQTQTHFNKIKDTYKPNPSQPGTRGGGPDDDNNITYVKNHIERIESLLVVLNTDIFTKIFSLLSNGNYIRKYKDNEFSKYIFIEVDTSLFFEDQDLLKASSEKYRQIYFRKMQSADFQRHFIFIYSLFKKIQSLFNEKESFLQNILKCREDDCYPKLITVVKYLYTIEKYTLNMIEIVAKETFNKDVIEQDYSEMMKSNKRVFTIAKRRHDNYLYDESHPYFKTQQKEKQFFGDNKLNYLDVYYRNNKELLKLFSYYNPYALYGAENGSEEEKKVAKKSIEAIQELGLSGVETPIYLYNTGGKLKQYNTTEEYNELHKFGPFDYIYNEGNVLSNNKISHDIKDDLTNRLKTNDIMMLGLGQSGSGKTSTLIQFSKNGEVIEKGVLIHFLESLQNLIKIEISCANLYYKDDKNNLNSYDDFKPENYLVQKIVNEGDSGYSLENLEKIDHDKTIIKTFNFTEETKKETLKELGDLIITLFLNRQTFPTPNNERSSRSHIIICLTITTNEIEGRNLVVCDLAGVENEFLCESDVDLFERQYGKISEEKSEESEKIINGLFEQNDSCAIKPVSKYEYSSKNDVKQLTDSLNEQITSSFSDEEFNNVIISIENYLNDIIFIYKFFNILYDNTLNYETQKIQNILEQVKGFKNDSDVKNVKDIDFLMFEEFFQKCEYINFDNAINSSPVFDLKKNTDTVLLKNFKDNSGNIYNLNSKYFDDVEGFVIEFLTNDIEEKFKKDKKIISSNFAYRKYYMNGVRPHQGTKIIISEQQNSRTKYIYKINLIDGIKQLTHFITLTEEKDKIYKLYNSDHQLVLYTGTSSYNEKNLITTTMSIIKKELGKIEWKDVFEKINKSKPEFLSNDTISKKIKNIKTYNSDLKCLTERKEKILGHCNQRLKEGFMINKSLAELSDGITSIVSENSFYGSPIYLERQIAPSCRYNFLNYFNFDKYDKKTSDESEYGIILTIIKDHFNIDFKKFFIYTLLVYNTSFFSEPLQSGYTIPDNKVETNIIKPYQDFGRNLIHTVPTPLNTGVKNNPPNPSYVNINILKYFTFIANSNIEILKEISNHYRQYIRSFNFYRIIEQHKFDEIFVDIEQLEQIETIIVKLKKWITYIERNNAGTFLGTLETADSMQSISFKDVRCNSIANTDTTDSNLTKILELYNKSKGDVIGNLKTSFDSSPVEGKSVGLDIDTIVNKGNTFNDFGTTKGGRRTRKKYKKKRKTRNKKRKVNMSKVINKKVIKTKRI